MRIVTSGGVGSVCLFSLAFMKFAHTLLWLIGSFVIVFNNVQMPDLWTMSRHSCCFFLSGGRSTVELECVSLRVLKNRQVTVLLPLINSTVVTLLLAGWEWTVCVCVCVGGFSDYFYFFYKRSHYGVLGKIAVNQQPDRHGTAAQLMALSWKEKTSGTD